MFLFRSSQQNLDVPEHHFHWLCLSLLDRLVFVWYLTLKFNLTHCPRKQLQLNNQAGFRLPACSCWYLIYYWYSVTGVSLTFVRRILYLSLTPVNLHFSLFLSKYSSRICFTIFSLLFSPSFPFPHFFSHLNLIHPSPFSPWPCPSNEHHKNGNLINSPSPPPQPLDGNPNQRASHMSLTCSCFYGVMVARGRVDAGPTHPS